MELSEIDFRDPIVTIYYDQLFPQYATEGNEEVLRVDA